MIECPRRNSQQYCRAASAKRTALTQLEMARTPSESLFFEEIREAKELVIVSMLQVSNMPTFLKFGV
jgi:hypothetical protein